MTIYLGLKSNVSYLDDRNNLKPYLECSVLSCSSDLLLIIYLIIVKGGIDLQSAVKSIPKPRDHLSSQTTKL